jgi:predicted phosphodiesterase
MSSSPVKERVHQRLSYLLKEINAGNKSLGPTLCINSSTDKIIVMSDLHKGSGNDADDFKTAEPNYTAACYYYLQNEFTYIALGDIEELWENNIIQVVANNENTIALEKAFLDKDRFYKVIGNHDLFWRNTPFFAAKWLKQMYGKIISVHEGLLLKATIGNKTLDIFLTHGHQGDKTSDGNKFSKWFVANVWSKVQAFLDINPNTPAQDFLLRDKHNKMMYDWSTEQQNTILITGHTHKPVFASQNHIEKLQQDIAKAKEENNTALLEKLNLELIKKMQEYISAEPFSLKKPSYFNTGCCCFSDGDITAVEIENNCIRLVKWGTTNKETDRYVLQEINLMELVKEL